MTTPGLGGSAWWWCMGFGIPAVPAHVPCPGLVPVGSRNVSPVTPQGTIPPTRKAGTCSQQHLPSGMSPVSTVLSYQGSRDMPPQYVPSATCPVCTVPSTHESRDMSLAPRAVAGTSRVRCPFLPWEQGCVPTTRPPTGAGRPQDTCLWGCPTCPFLLWEQGYVSSATPSACPMCTVPSCHGSRDMSPLTHGTGDMSHVHCPTTPQGQGQFSVPHATGAISLLWSRGGSCPHAMCHQDIYLPRGPIPWHMSPHPVCRPDGRGRPARGGPACSQAGGQRVPAPAPGPHLRPGGSAGFGR